MTGVDHLTIKGFIKPEALEQIVYDKLHEIGIRKEDYPINPYELIEKEKIILQEVPLDSQDIKGMIVYGPNKTGILINANRNYVSRRFIAMHELCHYWFHPKEAKRVCFEEYQSRSRGIEWQANNAAAYALMPKELVIELYDHYFGDINAMADWLKVSVESLKYRVNELKLKPIKNPFAFTQVSNNYFVDTELLSLENHWLYGGL